MLWYSSWVPWPVQLSYESPDITQRQQRAPDLQPWRPVTSRNVLKTLKSANSRNQLTFTNLSCVQTTQYIMPWYMLCLTGYLDKPRSNPQVWLSNVSGLLVWCLEINFCERQDGLTVWHADRNLWPLWHFTDSGTSMPSWLCLFKIENNIMWLGTLLWPGGYRYTFHTGLENWPRLSRDALAPPYR